MTPDIILRQGDRLPGVSRTVTVDGVAVDLTGYTGTFTATLASGGASIGGTATIDADQVTNKGKVAYSWSAGDATAAPGFYLGRFVVTKTGQSLSAPNDGWLVIQITGDAVSETVDWSYSGDPSARPLDTVRFLIGDTDSSDKQLADAEILWYLSSTNGNVYQAGARACGQLGAKYSRLAGISRTVGDLSISRSQNAQADAYAALAVSILAQGDMAAPPMPIVNADNLKSTAERQPGTNTDFTIGQFDNGRS
jgi:hypothetical protein